MAYKPHYEFGDGIDMPRVLRGVHRARAAARTRRPRSHAADVPAVLEVEVYNGDPAIDLSHARDARTFNQMCGDVPVLAPMRLLKPDHMGVTVVVACARYNMRTTGPRSRRREADIAWLCLTSTAAPLGSKASDAGRLAAAQPWDTNEVVMVFTTALERPP